MDLKRFSLGKEKETKSNTITTHNKEPSNAKSSKIDGGKCSITFEFNLGHRIPVFEYRKDSYLFKMMFIAEFDLLTKQDRVTFHFSSDIIKNMNSSFSSNNETIHCDLLCTDQYSNWLHNNYSIVSEWDENEIFNLLLYGYICSAFSRSGIFHNIDDTEWCKLYSYIEDFVNFSLECYQVKTRFKFDFTVINNALKFVEVTENIELNKVAMPLALYNYDGYCIQSGHFWISLLNHCIYVLDNNNKLYAFSFGDITLSGSIITISYIVYNLLYITLFTFKMYASIDFKVNAYVNGGVKGYFNEQNNIVVSKASELKITDVYQFYKFIEELFKNSITQLLGNKVKDMLGFKQS